MQAERAITLRDVLEINTLINKYKDAGDKYFKRDLIWLSQSLKEDLILLENKEKEMQSLIKPFQDKQLSIYEKYGEKQDTGYRIVNKYKELATQELNSLKEEYKDIIETHNKNLKELEGFLNTTVTRDLHLIDFKNIPEIISFEDLYVLETLKVVDNN